MSMSLDELLKELEPPFCYYVYVIKHEGTVDYFHYGLWKQETKGIRAAQENLARLMKSLIPNGVKKVLDVGCGLGRTTYDLTTGGYNVVGISPDENLMKMARAKYRDSDLQLMTTSFERYKGTDNFDLVLFQESSQYKLADCILAVQKAIT